MKMLPLGILLLGLAACGGDKGAEKKAPPPVLVTTVLAKQDALEVVERTLGTLEATQDPKVAAEVAGKILRLHVASGQGVRKGQLLAELDPADTRNAAGVDQAEVARLEALSAQQQRLLARQSELVKKNFISKNALEDVAAQSDALKNQLAAARAKAALSGGHLSKTRVLAPADGVVETQWVAVGDYVKLGDPLFSLVFNGKLRANLPFPEGIGGKIKRGMPVSLLSPLVSGPVSGVVEEIRPALSEGSRAVSVVVRIDKPEGLKHGGSVDATVTIGKKDAAVLVPEQSVVLRPAGKVVYGLIDGKAQQVVVETGARQKGMVEILQGLKGGETLALDGAGFLSQGATVSIRDPAAKPATSAPKAEVPK